MKLWGHRQHIMCECSLLHTFPVKTTVLPVSRVSSTFRLKWVNGRYYGQAYLLVTIQLKSQKPLLLLLLAMQYANPWFFRHDTCQKMINLIKLFSVVAFHKKITFHMKSGQIHQCCFWVLLKSSNLMKFVHKECCNTFFPVCSVLVCVTIEKAETKL